MKTRKRPIFFGDGLLTAALTLALAVFGAQAQPTPAAGTDAGVPRLLEPLGAPPQYSPRAAAAAQASYPVRVRFDVVRGLRAEQDVRLEFSGTEHWDGKVERVEERNPDSYSVFGSIAGAHQGYFVFTVDSGGFAGTIQIPQENLLADLRNIEREEYWLHIFDGRKAHQFKCGVPPPPEREEPGTTPLEGPDIRWAPGDPVPQQDIMVLYTQGLLIPFRITIRTRRSPPRSSTSLTSQTKPTSTAACKRACGSCIARWWTKTSVKPGATGIGSSTT